MRRFKTETEGWPDTSCHAGPDGQAMAGAKLKSEARGGEIVYQLPAGTYVIETRLEAERQARSGN